MDLTFVLLLRKSTLQQLLPEVDFEMNETFQILEPHTKLLNLRNLGRAIGLLKITNHLRKIKNHMVQLLQLSECRAQGVDR
jgi:septum formation inhibitor MinC